MYLLGDKVKKIRSKNAGPFWITIDIFCGSKQAFKEVRNSLDNIQISQLFEIPGQTLKRFEIESLNVISFHFLEKSFKVIFMIEICMEPN